MHSHDVQAEIEVLAESAVAICGFQVAVGCRDDAYVDADLIVLPTGRISFSCKTAEELGLHFEGQLADFVKEDSAAIRGLEQPGFCFSGAGKRAFLVAEELASISVGTREPQSTATKGVCAIVPRNE